MNSNRDWSQIFDDNSEIFNQSSSSGSGGLDPEYSYEEENCPMEDLVNRLLESTYDPAPFGVHWTDSDILDFLKNYGYSIYEFKEDGKKCWSALKADMKEPKSYNPNQDFKKVFIDLCRDKSKKLLLKRFKEVDKDDNNE